MKHICKFFIAFFLILIIQPKALFSQDTKQLISFNGYSQFRFTENFENINSFSLEKLKLWIKSTPDNSRHWDYRIQTTLSSRKNERFILQDVKIIYKFNDFKINIGQFIPQFSLQRFQSDYIIPLSERTKVIDNMIPNGSLGLRDIGFEFNYTSKNKKIETWAGIFNGNGINEYNINNSGILLTHKTAIDFFNNHFKTGYSIMYRKINNLKISRLLPEDIIYSGDDFRYNFFAQYQTKKINLQAEYINAQLGDYKAQGYYFLSSINFKKNQAVFSFDKYKDAIDSSCDDPIIHLGYNYLINQDKLKIMLDNSFQVNKSEIKNYSVNIQLQILLF